MTQHRTTRNFMQNFGTAERIRVPLPAARITIAVFDAVAVWDMTVPSVLNTLSVYIRVGQNRNQTVLLIVTHLAGDVSQQALPTNIVDNIIAGHHRGRKTAASCQHIRTKEAYRRKLAIDESRIQRSS